MMGQLEHVRIEDRLTGATEFEGEEIARVSTQNGAPGQSLDRPRRRWGENAVWKLESGRYVLLRAAFSTIYHTNPTTCTVAGGSQSGDVATLDDLPDDAYPCWNCHAPDVDDLGDQEKIRFEFPRRTIDQCETPAQVVSRLTDSRKYSGVRSTSLPEPARDLIEQCMLNDPDFRAAEMPVQRIT
jgi:hypothetical protein